MRGKYRYLISFIFIALLPTVVTLAFLSLKELMMVLVIYLVGIPFFFTWDKIATREKAGSKKWIWQFSPYHTLGIKVRGIPIEEFLFMFTAVAFPVGAWNLVEQLEFTLMGSTLAVLSVAIAGLLFYPLLDKPDF